MELSVESGYLNRNVVEVGWRVAPSDSQDEDPHLFVFHWVRGRPGCYDGCGFVRMSDQVVPGMNLGRWVGATIDLGLVSDRGTWWVSVDDVWVGYFPAAEWNGEFQRTETIRWFGEVFTRQLEPVSEMGTGKRPQDPDAAEIALPCDVDLATWTCRFRPRELRVDAPERYDAMLRPNRTIAYGGRGAGSVASHGLGDGQPESSRATASAGTLAPAEVTPPRPPSSASAETPAARGTSGTSPPR